MLKFEVSGNDTGTVNREQNNSRRDSTRQLMSVHFGVNIL